MPHPPASIAHIGVAVPSIADAVGFYRDILEIEPQTLEPSDGANIVSLAFGDTEIELLEPSTPDGPIARFLDRRGPGIHHICLKVPDLEAALSRCRAAGYRLVDEVPRPGAHGGRIAFLHPNATAGVLLELTE